MQLPLFRIGVLFLLTGGVIVGVTSGHRPVGSYVLIAVGWALIGASALRDAWEKQRGPQKRCPDCAEPVAMEARVCKHCGYRFPPDPDHL